MLVVLIPVKSIISRLCLSCHGDLTEKTAPTHKERASGCETRGSLFVVVRLLVLLSKCSQRRVAESAFPSMTRYLVTRILRESDTASSTWKHLADFVGVRASTQRSDHAVRVASIVPASEVYFGGEEENHDIERRQALV